VSQTTIAPVRVSVLINREVAEVFRVFTEEMAAWWPLGTHSIAADTHRGRVRAETVVFEGRVGGRIYERMSDGAEADWGAVLVWEPPHRVVFSWKPNLTPGPMTEVEVRFIAEGATTRVDLEHRAWERLGERAPDARRAYESGWPGVLGRFAERAKAGGQP
jgi:uncharacterized protein YndB with AHSA1/START domain